MKTTLGFASQVYECVSKISIVSYEPEKHTLYGFYYNYRIVMVPKGDKSGKIAVGVYMPGDMSEDRLVMAEEVTTRRFNRAMINAVAFIKQHFSRV